MDLPFAHGAPPLVGRFRVEPEDFFVEEVLGFDADGSGSHVLLLVEKRDANTGWVAAELARAAGIASRDVGVSGQKDRRAVARQTFSLPWPASVPLDACLAFSGEGYRVLAAQRHGRKLRPGSHRANRFVIRLRDASGDQEAIESRLSLVGSAGVPNYFGPQRYGRGQANLASARGWAAGGAAPRDRARRGFALSTARSEIFNLVLAERVRRGNWNRLLAGEAVILDGRRSFFRAAEIDAALVERCSAMDLHPSGPLWGRGPLDVGGEALAVEESVVAAELALRELLEAHGMDQERRSLRLPVRFFEWRFEDDSLFLSFELPRGTFATSVLHEVLQGAWNTGEGGAA
ncbi:MAG: tRNA pseudouridine(13) synthase TruD [Steroidobacteraceae bacterium]|nr:tRNA pseudouridine(13) synthase TruD [Steroidobacteraceae bacterium]